MASVTKETWAPPKDDLKLLLGLSDCFSTSFQRLLSAEKKGNFKEEHQMKTQAKIENGARNL